MRDATVTTKPPPTFDAFFLPLTDTYSVNWRDRPCFVRRPRGGRARPRPSGGGPAAPPSVAREAGMLLDAVGGGDEEGDDDMVVDLTPEFEAHVRDLSNWTLGRSFADTFPQWEHCVRIKN